MELENLDGKAGVKKAPRESEIYRINWSATKENVCQNVTDGIKRYIMCDDAEVGIVLKAKMLNPFLKCLENMNEVKNILILPTWIDEQGMNVQAYAVFKYKGEINYVTKYQVERL